MSDHLIAEAHRHAMALPTTHPTHADIAWYVREVSGLRAELALLREWQREVIQNANAHHAERKDAIARAESAEREAFDWKKIARYEAARAARAEREVAGLKANNRFQRGHSAGYAEAKADCATELAAERARLDWLEENAKDIMKYNCRSYIWFAHQNIRAAIDAAMKEDAK